jgi:predicted ribosomally synthesized peptide with nif11-like leader
MSKEHAKKFIEHIQKDPALRARVNDASDHVIKVAKEHGYDVSRADLRSALKEHWTQQKDDADEASFAFSEAPGF